MDISSIDKSGALRDTSAAVTGLGKKMGDSRPADSTGANGDADPTQVKQMVAQMQDHLDSMNISIQYSFYGEHGEKIAIKVVNKETGDVIREIPAKELQALQSKMSELCGMIFSGKV